MGTEVAKFDAAKFKLARQNAAAAAQPASFVTFLKMTKFGEWLLGRDEEPVPEDGQLLVDPDGFVQGWQCWANTDIKGVAVKLQGEVIGPLMGPLLPCPTEQHENTRGWQALLGLSAVMDGRKITYTTTSDGGKKAVFKLLDAIIAQGSKDPDKSVAVVELGTDSYMHPNKTRGEIFTPQFNVRKWITQAQAAKLIKEAIANPPPAEAPPTRKAPVKTAARKRA